MELMHTKKDKQELEDELKLLATNIEVINQRLASTASYGIDEYHAVVGKGLDDISSKLSTMFELMKSNEMDIRRLIEEDRKAIFEQLQRLGSAMASWNSSSPAGAGSANPQVLEDVHKELKNMNAMFKDLIRVNYELMELLRRRL